MLHNPAHAINDLTMYSTLPSQVCLHTRMLHIYRAIWPKIVPYALCRGCFPGGAGSTADVLRELEVQGTTFNPDAGQIVGLAAVDASMQAVAAVCTACNEARLESVVRQNRPPGVTPRSGGFI